MAWLAVTWSRSIERNWKISRLKGQPYDFYRSVEYVASAAGYDLDKVANSRPYSSGPLCRGRNSGVERGRRQPWLECNQLKGRSRSTRRFPVHRLANRLAGWLAWLVVTLRQVDDGWKQPERNLFRSPCKHRFTSGTEITSGVFLFFFFDHHHGRSIEVNYRNFSPIDSSFFRICSMVVRTNFTINGYYYFRRLFEAMNTPLESLRTNTIVSKLQEWCNTL